MLFIETPLQGAYLVELEPKVDERGFFSRMYCSTEFSEKGLSNYFVQINDSHTGERGTLRGLHYQLGPWEETKLVRCIAGSIYDVIVDLRPASKTFLQHFGAVLSANERTMMYVPKGFAHGFMTLEDHVEVIYLVSQIYAKEHERGLRWDDPRLNILWPFAPTVISERDRSHPVFDPLYHLGKSL